MDDRKTEACGRCGLSSVVDATGGDDADLYGDECIELEASQLKAANRHVELVGRVKRRLNAFAHRVIYGR
jgi:hypothetical protein